MIAEDYVRVPSLLEDGLIVPNVRRQIGYAGMRDEDGQVWVGWYSYGRWHSLPLRLQVRNHSPTGFEWGFCGSGPAQLALAILCHATRNPLLAAQMYQHFKWDIVARLEKTHWDLAQDQVFAWIRRRLEDVGKLNKSHAEGSVDLL